MACVLLYKNKKYCFFCQIYLEDSKKCITFAAENKTNPNCYIKNQPEIIEDNILTIKSKNA